MKIIKIISYWKKTVSGVNPLKQDFEKRTFKRNMAMAIVDFGYGPVTRHIEIIK